MGERQLSTVTDFKVISSDKHIRLSSDATNLLRASMSSATRRAYSTRLKLLSDWCIDNYGSFFVPLPPERLVEYIAFLAKSGKSMSCIEQTLSAVKLLHRQRNIDNPCEYQIVKDAYKGAVRTIGRAVHKKAPIRKEQLERIVSTIDRTTLLGKRDAALLLVCFIGAFRRSELVAIKYGDITETITAEGLPAYIVNVPRSKTDQEGTGMTKVIFSAKKDLQFCPFTALQEYIFSAQISDGYIFRNINKHDEITRKGKGITERTFVNMLQARAKDAGLHQDFAGHSLRSGFVTSAIEAGLQERAIQNQTGHKSLVVLRGYYQRNNVLSDNAAEDLF